MKMKTTLSITALAVSVMFCLSGKADTPAASFTSPGNMFNNGNGYSLGWEFTTNNAITVTAIGYFDDGGLRETHDVGIYNSSGVLLASAIVTGAGTQDGFFNYTSIAPITLTAGDTYQVMGSSGVVDPYAFEATGFSVNSNINFVQDEYSFGNSLQFGTQTDGLPASYFGANFLLGTAATPEPGSFALLGTGLLGFVGVMRRRLS